MNKFRKDPLEQIIPWYVNGTLPGKLNEKLNVDRTQNVDMQKSIRIWERVQYVVKAQKNHQPSHTCDQILFSRISEVHRSTFRLYHLYAFLISVVVFVFLWIIIKPGIMLQWTSENNHLRAFRIYRSVDPYDEFKLVHEYLVNQSDLNYRFVDALLIPWLSYSYEIRGVTDGVELDLSPAMSGKAFSVLPAQILLFSISLFIGYVGAWQVKIWVEIQNRHYWQVQG